MGFDRSLGANKRLEVFLFLSKTLALGSKSWKCSCRTNDFSKEALGKCQKQSSHLPLMQRGILLADGEGLQCLTPHVMDLGGLTLSHCVWVVFSVLHLPYRVAWENSHSAASLILCWISKTDNVRTSSTQGPALNCVFQHSNNSTNNSACQGLRIKPGTGKG